jgi:ribonucleoside-diphosphate reductase alpha chain
MHFYAWKRGLKTGMYYLRTKAAVDAVKFTVEKQAEPQLSPAVADVHEQPLNYQQYARDHASQVATAPIVTDLEQQYAAIACSLDDPEGCEMCGS